jgi:hypothetical protein
MGERIWNTQEEHRLRGASDPLDVGLSGIVWHCLDFGPRARSEVHYFSLSFTLRPRKLVEYLLYPPRGGDKLDRVSSASWQGVDPGPLGKNPYKALESIAS